MSRPSVLTFDGREARTYNLDMLNRFSKVSNRVITTLHFEKLSDLPDHQVLPSADYHDFQNTPIPVFTMMDGKAVVLTGRLQVATMIQDGKTDCRAILISNFNMRRARIRDEVPEPTPAPVTEPVRESRPRSQYDSPGRNGPYDRPQRTTGYVKRRTP